MLLNELKKGEVAEIIEVKADNALKERLNSLGLMVGESIEIKGTSLFGGTIKIEINGSSFVALRANEAKNIEVEEIL